MLGSNILRIASVRDYYSHWIQVLTRLMFNIQPMIEITLLPKWFEPPSSIMTFCGNPIYLIKRGFCFLITRLKNSFCNSVGPNLHAFQSWNTICLGHLIAWFHSVGHLFNFNVIDKWNCSNLDSACKFFRRCLLEVLSQSVICGSPVEKQGTLLVI